VKYKYKKINKCPQCNSKDYTLWDNNKNNEIKAFQCSNCSLVYMNKILTDEDLIDFYNCYNETRDNENIENKTKRNLMYELDYNSISSIVESGNFLDIGCGQGDFLNYFNNVKKIGYDIDQSATAIGSNVYDDIDFISSLDCVDDDTINCVLFRGTLQYMRDINKTIQYTYDKLKNNGYLCVLSLPNTDSPLAIVQKENWVMCNKIEHIQLFNYNSLEFLLRDKFKIIRVDYPYLQTPYENNKTDLQSFINIIKNIEGAETKHFPFWGSIMNVIIQKV
jgi:ubiquinone/menaquinone biosynthesis C-methylase UbiE